MADSVDRVSIVMDADKHITANFALIQNLSQYDYINSSLIYPNPTFGEVFLRVKGGGNSFYHVYDIKGVEIQSGNFRSDTSIEIRHPGIYLILINTEDEIKSERVIVN